MSKDVPLTADSRIAAVENHATSGDVSAKNRRRQPRDKGKSVCEIAQIHDRPIENWGLAGND